MVHFLTFFTFRHFWLLLLLLSLLFALEIGHTRPREKTVQERANAVRETWHGAQGGWPVRVTSGSICQYRALVRWCACRLLLCLLLCCSCTCCHCLLPLPLIAPPTLLDPPASPKEGWRTPFWGGPPPSFFNTPVLAGEFDPRFPTPPMSLPALLF